MVYSLDDSEDQKSTVPSTTTNKPTVSDQTMKVAAQNKLMEHRSLPALEIMGDENSSIEFLVKQRQFQLLDDRCAQRPQEFAQRDKYNLFSCKSEAYPLHYLCRSKTCPASTIRTVIQAAPQALTYQDPVWKSTPLHLACYNGLSLHCILEIIKANPQSLTMADLDGNLPVHVAVTNADPQIVLALWDAHPTGAKTRKGNTVLHLAVSRSDASALVVNIFYSYFEKLSEEYKATLRAVKRSRDYRRVMKNAKLAAKAQ